MKAIRFGIAFCAALNIATLVFAQPADPLIDQGVALREQGHDAEALVLFRRSYESSHAPRALAQLGLAEQALGQWVDAQSHLSDALATHDAWIESHRDVLGQALSVVGSHVGRIELRGGLDGAEVFVNGERAGTLPLREPLVVAAGSAVIEVREGAHYPFRREVSVAAGSLARESVTMTAREGGAAPTAASSGGGGPSAGSLALLIGGGGVAVAGAVLLAIGLVDKANVEGAPVHSSWPNFSGSADLAPPLIAIGDVALALGVTAAVLGLVWWLVAPESARAEQARFPSLQASF